VCGPKFSSLLKLYCLAEAELSEDNKVGPQNAMLANYLPVMMAKDSAAGPKTLGDYGGSAVLAQPSMTLTYDNT
jgi:hypothetical protein